MSAHAQRQMRIVDLRPGHAKRILQAAALLFEGFREHWPKAWPGPGKPDIFMAKRIAARDPE